MNKISISFQKVGGNAVNASIIILKEEQNVLGAKNQRMIMILMVNHNICFWMKMKKLLWKHWKIKRRQESKLRKFKILTVLIKIKTIKEIKIWKLMIGTNKNNSK